MPKLRSIGRLATSRFGGTSPSDVIDSTASEFPAGIGRRVAARSLLSGALAAALGGCTGGVLDPHGPITAAERTILLNSIGIMLGVIVPVIVATLGVAWWYRVSNDKARYRPTWSYSGKIEIVTWAIPAMVILLLGSIAWISSHDLAPEKPLEAQAPGVEVEVVALDWKWLFIYPRQGVASVNIMVVPAGAPVSLKLTSATVMNSFFIPQLGSQIYTMAGMTTRLNLLADHPGQYRGLSAQFSGDGFSGMCFSVEAVAPQQFATWVSDTQHKGGALDWPGYTELSKPSKYVVPSTYGAVDPGLFERIVGPEHWAAGCASTGVAVADSARDDNAAGDHELSKASVSCSVN